MHYTAPMANPGQDVQSQKAPLISPVTFAAVRPGTVCPAAEVLGNDGDHPDPPGWLPHPLHICGVRGPVPGAHARREASIQAGEYLFPLQTLSSGISGCIYEEFIFSKSKIRSPDAVVVLWAFQVEEKW